MPANIELKARCDDLDRAAEVCLKKGAHLAEVLVQTDTYFKSSSGRLKLRETADRPAQLIWYARPDLTESRRSDYLIAPIADAAPLKVVLAHALGVLVVVRKRRQLLLWRNVRIHLDRVDELGCFIEFEAVLSAQEKDETGHARIAELCTALDVKAADLVSSSYSDVLLNRPK